MVAARGQTPRCPVGFMGGVGGAMFRAPVGRTVPRSCVLMAFSSNYFNLILRVFPCVLDWVLGIEKFVLSDVQLNENEMLIYISICFQQLNTLGN